MFTKAFWVATLEATVVAFATAFAGSLVVTTTPSVKGLLAALVAGGVGAIYAFVKQVGSVQTVNALKAGKPTTVAK